MASSSLGVEDWLPTSESHMPVCLPGPTAAETNAVITTSTYYQDARQAQYLT